MKKTLWLLLALLTTLFLTGCKDTKPAVSESSEIEDASPTEAENTIAITLVNEVEETDIWILPDTKENRKLSLWGTATMPAVQLNEERACALPDSEAGTYVIHMITPDSMYYGVSDIPLDEGYSIRFYKETDPYIVWYVEVIDTNGQLVGSYEVFCAAL